MPWTRATWPLLLCVAACRPADESEPPTPLGDAPLAATASATWAELCEEPPRAWAILGASGEVGVTQGDCVPGEAGEWKLRSVLALRDESKPRWELDVWVAENGPQRAQLRTGEVTTEFTWRDDGVHVVRFGDRRVLQTPGAVPWLVPDHALYLRETMLRRGIGRSERGLHHVAFEPLHEEVRELDLELNWVQGGAEAIAGPARLDLSGATSLADAKIAGGEVDGVPLYASTEASALAPRLPSLPEPAYTSPEDLSVAAVRVPGKKGEPALAGELVQRGDAGEGKAPGVLYIAGAGPQDRWGIVPGSGIDTRAHEIQDALARAGFAVLRIDDRSVGESDLGASATPGFLDYVGDARRALATLASHPQVDPRELIVIGHGEGSLVASMLCAERPKLAGKRRSLAGVVMLSAPGRNARELVYDEIRRSMEGRPKAEIDATLAEAKQVHDAALADKDLPAHSEPQRQWMQEIFAIDPLQVLGKCKAPVLAAHGEKDFQVSTELDFQAIVSALRKNAAPGSEARLFHGLDHLLLPEAGRSHAGHYLDPSRRVDPEFLVWLAEWARARTGL